MAKLDFFARYPDFFEAAIGGGKREEQREAVESAMVRHHYGPWDKRYYHVLAHLESKNLITVVKDKSTFRITLTPEGSEKARRLAGLDSFKELVVRMREIKKAFGAKSGTALKDMIYKKFDEQVGKRRMGEVIEQ